MKGFNWAEAAQAWKSNVVDWQPAQKILDEPPELEATELGLQELLEYVTPYLEASFESNAEAAEQAEELYFTYLFNVTSADREAVFLKACRFALETGSVSEQPLLADTVCKAFLSVTLPRILDLCDARFENDYDAVLVTYHDNGLFANVLQLLDALLLSKPGVPVLVDWQRSGGEGHFQYGPVGFDLFHHLFASTKRCRNATWQDGQRSRLNDFRKRVNILFMNMLRGLIWKVPEKEFQALRNCYHRAMQGALQPSPLMCRKLQEVCDTWPEGARVVGVHKRLGTNEVAACQLAQRNPPPEEYLAMAKMLLQQTPPGVPQVLYLATDEVQTAEAFRKALPPGGKIQLCCREGVKRSRGGVRADGIDNEVHRSPCEAVDAEDAFLDSLCLSKCSDLVCIDSNLSIFVSMLNPQIRVHPMGHAVPPGWEEKASHPTEAVFTSYRVVWSPGIFISALPSTAAEIVGQARYDEVLETTGRFWEGWVELKRGGWARVQGGKSGCWAMEHFNGYVSMFRVSQGELLVSQGVRFPRSRRPEEPLPDASCQGQTSSYCANTWLQVGRAEWKMRRTSAFPALPR